MNFCYRINYNIDFQQNMKSSLSFFAQLSKNSIYLAIFLIPLFFLPFTQNVLGYPKQTLLLFLVFLGLIGWLAEHLIQRKIILRENQFLYLIIFLILLFFFFSTIFSLWPTASFWGWPLSNTDNFLTFFSLLLLVFLFVNTFQTEGEVLFALFLLLISGTVAGLFLLFQLYGLFISPFDFAKISSFNTLGSVSQAAIFLAVLLPLSLVLAFRIKKPIFWLVLLILLALVILIDFNQAWISLLPGILTLTIFGLTTPQGKIKSGFLVTLMVILVLSLFFLFFPLRFAGFPVLPLEVSPGIVSEMEILKGVYTEGIKNTLLGSGPGTFVFDYSKYRSPLLNQTFFWGTRFSSGNSEFLDWFITKGLFGGISLLFFLGLIIYFGVKGLTKLEDPLGMRLGFLASAISMVGAGFLSPFSFSLGFLFWVIIGGLLFYSAPFPKGRCQEPELQAINLHHKEERRRVYNFKEIVIELNSQFRRTVFSIVILAVIILGLVLIFFQSQKYLAEVNYSQGIKFSQKNNIDQAINSIQKATLFNPSIDTYWRDLAQLYLGRANLVAQAKDVAAEDKRRLVQENITNGVQSLNQAITLAPFNVANWNVKGFFYRSLIGVSRAAEVALESYRRATELEPASPFPYGEMGRVYILMAQDFNQKQMEKEKAEALSLAIQNLEKSIELKSDYAPAHYLIAVAYDQQGKEEEAISRLEEIKNLFPQDIGIPFQLGMLYWRKEKLDQAQGEFERLIKLSPGYSNARYMLGLVYDKKGEKEKAKEQFEEVAKLNPTNQEVAKILENLKGGRPALEGIIPAQPPIGEVPPEIQP